MRALTLGGAARSPRSGVHATELLSLEERGRYLGVLRVALVLVAGGTCVAWPQMLSVPAPVVVLTSAVYLILSAVPMIVESRSRRMALPLLQGALLLDGLYLVAMIAMTGDATSPVRFLLPAHVVAVTLLCSYRTGLKLALWHTLLFLLVVQAAQTDIVPESDGALGDMSHAMLAVATIWFVVLCTAAFAAASERELRRQKADLGSLDEMTSRLEERPSAAEIPAILLEELCGPLGFRRGLVIGGNGADSRLLAALGTDAEVPGVSLVPLDPIVAGVLMSAEPQLVKRLDESSAPRLREVLPEAHNVVVLPMVSERAQALGVVVLEHGGSNGTMTRWALSVAEQFVSRASLALRNAWLTEERDRQFERIRDLEQDLRTHNAELEVTVQERTSELREMIEVLKETDDQRRRLLDHVVRIAEDERQRIANDIHDDPLQKLVALKMRLELMSKGDPDEDTGKGIEAVAKAVGSLRHLLFDLHPPVLEQGGIGSAIRYLLDHSEVPFAVSVDDDAVENEPAPQVAVVLYRIAQEAVANARKHSNADHLEVKLTNTRGGITMEIVDDGDGFLPQEAVLAAPGHMGLAAMRERAEMAGGTCVLRSLPGDGTTLEVWLPLMDDGPKATYAESLAS